MRAQAYLDPQDDGLPMRPAGIWARSKLYYLERYIGILETSMRLKFPTRHYIDLLAGPGKNRVRGSHQVLLGSPLLALNAKYPFTGYFFVDADPQNTFALQQRCNASPHRTKVDVRTGDCNTLVDDIVAELKRSERISLNLAFLDPEGLELRWDTVTKLASVQKMDLIINYPESGIKRNMRQQLDVREQTSVDGFFGDRGWRTIYAECQGRRGCQRRLIDWYKKRLQEWGYQEVVGDYELGTEPLMRNEKQAPLYRLLFASKHPLGQEFWQKIVRRDVDGQIQLPLM